jgi:hypothetical protein
LLAKEEHHVLEWLRGAERARQGELFLTGRDRRARFGVLAALLSSVACTKTTAHAPPIVRVPIAQRAAAPGPASTEESRAPVVLAAPHPAIDGIFAPYLTPGVGAERGRAEDEDDDDPQPPAMTEEECRKLTGFDGSEIARCDVVLLASHTAPCVIVVHDCGAHLCDTDYYVWHGGANEPYHYRDGGSATVEVSPDHRHLIVSGLVYGEPTAPPEAGQTERIDFASGRREPFASCLSTVLSPRGRYYLCRDLAGRVLSFPVAGGALTVVVAKEVPPDDPIKIGGAFADYPAPVEFKDASTFTYTLYLQSERVVTHDATFTE